MRARLTTKGVFSPTTLDRILDDLERDLVDASDEELLEAAKALGLNPAMKGSAAFLGLKHPARARLKDYFGLDLFESGPGDILLAGPGSKTRAKRRKNS